MSPLLSKRARARESCRRARGEPGRTGIQVVVLQLRRRLSPLPRTFPAAPRLRGRAADATPPPPRGPSRPPRLLPPPRRAARPDGKRGGCRHARAGAARRLDPPSLDSVSGTGQMCCWPLSCPTCL